MGDLDEKLNVCSLEYIRLFIFTTIQRSLHFFIRIHVSHGVNRWYQSIPLRLNRIDAYTNFTLFLRFNAPSSVRAPAGNSGRRCAMSFPFRQFSKVSHIRVGTHTHTSNAATHWMWKRDCFECEEVRGRDRLKKKKEKIPDASVSAQLFMAFY